MAQAFDPDARTLKGDPVSLQEGVNVWLPRAKGDFSASQNGILLSFLGGTSTREEFVWINDRGEQQTIVEANTWTGVALSPDERRIAFDEIEGQSQRTDIWIYDLGRSVKTKLTFSEQQSLRPLWSRDGSIVYYSGELGGSKALLFEKHADGSGKDVVLAQGDNTNSVIAPFDVSPDGRTLVAGIIYGSKGELGVIDLRDTQRPSKITLLGVQAERAKFSPDGRWLVYQSDISGKREVYVRSMTGDEGQYQISSGAGEEPLWSASGILYYSSIVDGYMKVPVTFSGGRPVFGQARPLLPPNTTRIRSIYAVTKDGKRFLGARALAGRGSNMLTAVVHWPDLLKK
jgi:WD40 repeat protein